jgi:hypothetical protein
MAKSDVDKITEEKLAKGGILVKFYFDMQDDNKERIQPLLVDLINERLMKEKGVVYCYGTVEEPIEREGIWMTSAMVNILLDSFMPLINIAFHYSPAGIEILKPTHDISFKPFELQSMLMDISQVSLDYSRYIFEKVLSPEDLEKIKRQMNNRAEVAKKVIKTDEKV